MAEITRIHDVNPYHQAEQAGYGLTWYVTNDAPGRYAVTHGGDMVLFHSVAKYYLDGDYGLIVSQNTEHFPITAEMGRRFDALVGVPDLPSALEQPDAAEDALVAGEYTGSRYSGHGILKISKLLRASTVVRALPDGDVIQIGNSEYQRIAPLTYQAIEGGWRVTFFTDAAGKVTHTSTGMTPTPFLERKGVAIGQGAITLSVLAFALLAGLGAAALKTARGATETAPWLCAGAMAAFMFAGLGILAAQFMGIQSDIYSMTPARDPAFRLAQGLMVLGLICLGALAWTAVQRLVAGRLGAASATTLSVFILAGVSAWMMMATWNLLSWSLNY